MVRHEREEPWHITEGRIQMQELKDAVVKLLVSNYDFLLEDAEVSVDESVSDSPDMWTDNAEAEELAKFLASDDVDE